MLDLDDIIIELGQHSNRGRRGMDATSCFGRRYTLYAVDAAFVFESAVRTIALDFDRDFFVAADAVLGGIEELDLPTHALCVAQVHAVEVRRKQGRLVAAFALAQFHNHRAFVVGIFGQQEQLE